MECLIGVPFAHQSRDLFFILSLFLPVLVEHLGIVLHVLLSVLAQLQQPLVDEVPLVLLFGGCAWYLVLLLVVSALCVSIGVLGCHVRLQLPLVDLWLYLARSPVILLDQTILALVVDHVVQSVIYGLVRVHVVELLYLCDLYEGKVSVLHELRLTVQALHVVHRNGYLWVALQPLLALLVRRVDLVHSLHQEVLALLEEFHHVVVLQVLTALQNAVGSLRVEELVPLDTLLLFHDLQVRHLVLLAFGSAWQLLLVALVREGLLLATRQVVLPVSVLRDHSVHQRALVVHLLGVSTREAVGLAVRGEQVNAQLLLKDSGGLPWTQVEQCLAVDVQRRRPRVGHLQDLLQCLRRLLVVSFLVCLQRVHLQSCFASQLRILHDVLPALGQHQI